MKLAFTTFACPDWSLSQIVDAALEIGYQGIELRCDARHQHGAEVWSTRTARRDAQALLEGNGLSLCCLATSLQLMHERLLEEMPKRVQLAADLGAPALRVFCGPFPEDSPRETAMVWVGDRLRIAAELAENYGVELWLETHDSASFGRDAAAILRRAEHKSLGVCYNNLHPFRQGEAVEDTFHAIGPLIRHAHFHDAKNDPGTVLIRPLGQGDLPIDDMFGRLIKAPSCPFVCGEWFDQMYGADPESSLKLYHADMMGLAGRHSVRLG